VGDTSFALVAALMIFPAVFAFGLNPASGPALAFITMPQVFAQLPWGSALAAAFFLLLLGAAITSTVSMLEVGTAALMQRTKLRRSTVAGLPIEDFHALLYRSIPFNRYLMNQLNERLGHFIAAREIDRQDDPDSRVAGSLAQLFNPVLYPGVGGLLRITQQELGYLVGLSRQRVNQALNTLAAQGLIGIEYGGVRVRDLEALRRFSVR
jgi:hypothetical protein